MSYCMRFIQTDEAPITLSLLEGGLHEESPAYSLNEQGLLCISGFDCARIEMLPSGDGQFVLQIAMMKDAIKKKAGRGTKRVQQVLDDARALVIVEVIWSDREPEETLQMIDPLWRWLFSNREGLVQADDEGFYDRTRRILAVE
jgi:hypothetical protein